MKVKEGYVYTHTALGRCFVLSILQEHGGNKMVVAYTDKKGLCAVEYYAFNKRVQSGSAFQDESYALIVLGGKYRRKGQTAAPDKPDTVVITESGFKEPITGVYYVSYKYENENLAKFCSCYEFVNTFVEIQE
nr:MAG TPA: hypothetical protein [Caudoviricetes sp.]